MTAIQYLIVQRIEAGVRKQGAQDIFGLESLFHYFLIIYTPWFKQINCNLIILIDLIFFE